MGAFKDSSFSTNFFKNKQVSIEAMIRLMQMIPKSMRGNVKNIIESVKVLLFDKNVQIQSLAAKCIATTTLCEDFNSINSEWSFLLSDVVTNVHQLLEEVFPKEKKRSKKFTFRRERSLDLKMEEKSPTIFENCISSLFRVLQNLFTLKLSGCVVFESHLVVDMVARIQSISIKRKKTSKISKNNYKLCLPTMNALCLSLLSSTYQVFGKRLLIHFSFLNEIYTRFLDQFSFHSNFVKINLLASLHSYIDLRGAVYDALVEQIVELFLEEIESPKKTSLSITFTSQKERKKNRKNIVKNSSINLNIENEKDTEKDINLSIQLVKLVTLILRKTSFLFGGISREKVENKIKQILFCFEEDFDLFVKNRLYSNEQFRLECYDLLEASCMNPPPDSPSLIGFSINLFAKASQKDPSFLIRNKCQSSLRVCSSKIQPFAPPHLSAYGLIVHPVLKLDDEQKEISLPYFSQNTSKNNNASLVANATVDDLSFSRPSHKRMYLQENKPVSNDNSNEKKRKTVSPEKNDSPPIYQQQTNISSSSPLKTDPTNQNTPQQNENEQLFESKQKGEEQIIEKEEKESEKMDTQDEFPHSNNSSFQLTKINFDNSSEEDPIVEIVDDSASSDN